MMEKLPLDGKENMSGPNPHYANYSDPYLLSNQFLPQNISKKPKMKPKLQKGFPSNVRAGDWVCLVCNNLNFSFRNECNRCQIQTKEQNQLQSLYISENHGSNDNLQNRFPFRDVTNHKYPQVQFDSLETKNKTKSTLLGNDLNSNLASRLSISAEPTESSIYNETNLNQGFKNMLLVTPPKRGQTKASNTFKEYSDSSQKELPPYKSPKFLPSVSPILKKVFEQEPKDASKREGRVSPYFSFLVEDPAEGKEKIVYNNTFNIHNADLQFERKDIEGPDASKNMRLGSIEDNKQPQLTEDSNFFRFSNIKDYIGKKEPGESHNGKQSSTVSNNI